MLKSEIIAEITAFYKDVGTVTQVESNDPSLPPNVTHYRVRVQEVGSSQKSKKPVFKMKEINFSVCNEGLPTEAAYYSDNEPINDVNSDITGDSTLYAINKIYTSEEIRKRVQAAVAQVAQTILNEVTPSSLLTSNASSSQYNVIVTDGSIFWIGQQVIINDNNNFETFTISMIDGNTITMSDTLKHSYSTANSSKLTYANNKERHQWAANAILNPDMYTAAMTSFVSLNATVQSQGGSVSDSTLVLIVSGNITKLAVASYQ